MESAADKLPRKGARRFQHNEPEVWLTAGIIVADVVGAGILAMPLVPGQETSYHERHPCCCWHPCSSPCRSLLCRAGCAVFLFRGHDQAGTCAWNDHAVPSEFCGVGELKDKPFPVCGLDVCTNRIWTILYCIRAS